MKKALLVIFTAMLSLNAFAQQALWGGGNVQTPLINEDGTVTFRFVAPKASKVQVTGDFLPTEKKEVRLGDRKMVIDAPGVRDLTEQPGGMWEYTTDFPVPGEFYNYTFIVDGLTVIDPNNVWVNRDVATLTSVLLVPKIGETSYLYAVHPVPHGTVSKVWYHSDEAGLDRRMTVYTPAGYEDSKTRYPVVYILHGMGGDEDAWVTQGRAAQILDNLIATGKAKPMIAVFTNGNIAVEAAPLENSFDYFHPSMNLPQTMEGSFETSFPEIVKFIDTHYRTIAKKQSRAICGLSMGGFHTLYLSINYPDWFDYSGMFSAAVGVTDPSVSPMYQDVDAKLAKYFSKKPKLLWIGIGKTDFLYGSNAEFRAKLDAAGYPYTYVESEGGHIWRNWRQYLAEFLPLLFQ